MATESMLYPVNNEIRQAQLLDGLWNFQFDEHSEGMEKKWQKTGLPNAIKMPVPASFADVFTEAKERDYCGDFWYEHEFYIRKIEKDITYAIRFGSVTHRCLIFCNGVLVREHEGGFLPVVADISDCIQVGKNVLTVLVNNELNDTSIPCGTTLQKNEKKVCIPSFDFFNYSGIHRSVWLAQIPKKSITDYSVKYELDGENAIVYYEVEAIAQGEIFVELADACGAIVAKAQGKSGILYVKHAHLWKVRNAYLYNLSIRVEQDGNLIDRYDAKIGIRTVEIKNEQFLVNGEPVYLKGFGKHEDFSIIGRGFNYAVAKRDFECMKWIGANCFRTSHYPYADEWYQMADEDGFLIIDEVPAVGLMKMFHVANAGSGSSDQGFFGSCKDRSLLSKNHETAISEMIKRDKNHPSVFSWSIFNEAETTTELSYNYFAPLFELARKLDPQKRPVTGVLEKTSSPQACRCYPLMDFICLNRYYGWYISGGDLCEAKNQFVEEMDEWSKKGLHVPFVFTEFGTDTLDSMHRLPSVMWSQEYQQEYLDMNFDVFDKYPFVQGELIWNYADFQTGQGIIRVNGNKKGIFTRDRQPKAAAFTVKKRWETKEE